MAKTKEWYTLEKNPNNKLWVVWHNHDNTVRLIGGCGFRGLYSSEDKNDCIKYCEKHKIKIINKKGSRIDISRIRKIQK